MAAPLPSDLPDPETELALSLLSDGTVVLSTDKGVVICLDPHLAASLCVRLPAVVRQAERLARLNSGPSAGLLN